MTTTNASSSTAAELSHASIGQWGGVIAGVLGGFAATVMMATLGAALGMTATAAAADEATAPTESGVATMGGAAIAWLLLSAIVVGAVGGIVLARSSRPDRSYHAGTLGLMTWTGGIVLAALIAAPGASGILAGLGNAAGAATATARFDGTRIDLADPAARRGENGARPMDASASRTNLTPEEQQRVRVAAEKAATAASVAAWAALGAQALSLIATIFAARLVRRKMVAVEPVGYALT